MYRSLVSLGRYTPKYFIIFVKMVNGTVSLISLSICSLLVYMQIKITVSYHYTPVRMAAIHGRGSHASGPPDGA